MRPCNIRIEYGKTTRDAICITETQRPVFGWSVHAGSSEKVKAFSAEVVLGAANMWSSGILPPDTLEVHYGGPKLITGEVYTLRVSCTDDDGKSASEERQFCPGTVKPWNAQWLADPSEKTAAVLDFVYDFMLSEECADACAFVCGLGYHKLYINGSAVFAKPLNPAFSEFEKRAYYSVLPHIGSCFRKGKNRVGVRVAPGWRNPNNVCYRLMKGIPAYTGKTTLSALIRLKMQDGSVRWIASGKDWRMAYDNIVSSDIMDGEIYDASRSMPAAREAGVTGSLLEPQIISCPSEKLVPQTLENVCYQKSYTPRSVTEAAPGIWCVDFGQNIAGVCRLKIPEGIAAGTRIKISHSEFLGGDGRAYLAQNRHARAADEYIAAGDGKDPKYWQPEFTYHGFRYAEIEGYPDALAAEDLCAVSLYTDCEKHTDFRCGSAQVNEFAQIARMTEKANIHSILTDCPQRDERMGWMNDATVRFEAVPYLFDIGRLFPKVIRDVMDTQSDDGSITCTAPFAFGSRPADPVCSAYIVAGWQAWLHTGNKEILREAYDSYKAWNRLLETHSRDGIVTYSRYGDWAGPSYACKSEEDAHSAVTPDELMSTGYHYLNTVLLSKIAALLDKEDEAREQEQDAQRIRRSFLREWVQPETGVVGTGSQACQAFALWLDILPVDSRQNAARVLHEDLVKHQYNFTTGNLCTRYMLEQLSRYGYVEDCWKLLTRIEYPSFGFMLQNEATTVWERFELKTNCSMNSHDHPMHASSYRWLYACLIGLTSEAGGWKKFSVKPVIPEALLSASATVETPRGDAMLRWVKRYGFLHVNLSVPYGSEASVTLPWGEHCQVPAGFYCWSKPLDEIKKEAGRQTAESTQ